MMPGTGYPPNALGLVKPKGGHTKWPCRSGGGVEIDEGDDVMNESAGFGPVFVLEVE